MYGVNIKRVRNLNQGRPASGPVLYWMSRDQRVQDNWALAYAMEIAANNNRYAMVTFTLSGGLPGNEWRHMDFMIKGLQKVESGLNRLNIPFIVLKGEPVVTLQQLIEKHDIGHLVTDFDPLKYRKVWMHALIKKLQIPVDEVDAHNIVPCWLASEKEEYAAFTLRPKITKLLPEFLDEFPPLVPQKQKIDDSSINWDALVHSLTTDHSVKPVDWIVAGETASLEVMNRFFEQGLVTYEDKRNDPNAQSTSNLSPYIRFGHIAAQRIALNVLKYMPRDPNTDAFLEELIIRKELSDNFCHYNQDYDQISGFRQWARSSLDEHRKDQRDIIYSDEQFERAQTHDSLWNAAQMQMVQTGTMHGYMRMYWAKKILEWTATPEEALKIALYLNDKYQLDGRCPNGYTGCAWSIGGVHDRAWNERSVFGKVRYMNRAGCERKFDVNRYINSMGQT